MSTLLNPTTVPQAYTAEGHMIAAGERIENVTLDEVGQGMVDTGRLRLLEEKKSDAKKSTKDKAATNTAGRQHGQGDPSPDAESTTSPARRSGDTPS